MWSGSEFVIRNQGGREIGNRKRRRRRRRSRSRRRRRIRRRNRKINRNTNRSRRRLVCKDVKMFILSIYRETVRFHSRRTKTRLSSINYL